MAANVGSHETPDLAEGNGTSSEVAGNGTPVKDAKNGTPMEVAGATEEDASTVAPYSPVIGLSRMLVSLTGTTSKIMSPQYFSHASPPKIETEIIELNLNEADTKRYAIWSRYEFKGNDEFDNFEMSRVPGKIKLFKDGAPDGFSPVLATVHLRRYEVRNQVRRDKLLAPMDVHHIMVHTGITKHPVLHELKAYVNKRVIFSDVEKDDKIFIIEDPEFKQDNYVNRDHVLHPQDFRTFKLMPSWESASIELASGKVSIVVQPEAADRSIPVDPFDVESVDSQEEDRPCALSKNQLDGSGDGDDDEDPEKRKGEKKKKKKSTSPQRSAPGPAVMSKSVEEMKKALQRFNHDESETRRWQEIQRREAEIKDKARRIKKMVKEFAKEAKELKKNESNEKKKLALQKKEERIAKAKKVKEELEADLVRYSGRNSAKPALRQTSLEETIPYSPIKRTYGDDVSVTYGDDVNVGAGPSGTSGLSRSSSVPSRTIREYSSTSGSEDEHVVYHSESEDEQIVYYETPIFIAKEPNLKKQVVPSKIWKQQVVRDTAAASRYWNSEMDSRSARARSNSIAAMSDILAGVEVVPVIQRLDGSLRQQLAAGDAAMRAARRHRRSNLKHSTPKKKTARVQTRSQKRIVSPTPRSASVGNPIKPAKRARKSVPKKSVPKKPVETKPCQKKKEETAVSSQQDAFSSTEDQDLLRASMLHDKDEEDKKKKASLERSSLAQLNTDEEMLDFEPHSSAAETEVIQPQASRVSVFDRLAPRLGVPGDVVVAEETVSSAESSDRERVYVGVPDRARRAEEAETDVDEE